MLAAVAIAVKSISWHLLREQQFFLSGKFCGIGPMQLFLETEPQDWFSRLSLINNHTMYIISVSASPSLNHFSLSFLLTASNARIQTFSWPQWDLRCIDPASFYWYFPSYLTLYFMVHHYNHSQAYTIKSFASLSIHDSHLEKTPNLLKSNSPLILFPC